MPNILIVDQLEQTGALIKSVLNNYYGVSLSADFPGAMKNLETALFDLVLMEAERLNADTEKFIRQAKEFLPNLPVLILTEHEESFKGLSAVRMISRPFRCANLMSAVYEALCASESGAAESATYHRALTYLVEMSASERNAEGGLKCSLTDLSRQGFMVEPAAPSPGRSAQNDKAEFQRFFKSICPEGRVSSKPLYARILMKEQEPIKINSRIAFVEQGPDDVFKRAGMSFIDAARQDVRLLEFLKQN